jgi:formylglycine-generating enzyme required for sulfatase activity/serine/threonine protein kinase
LGRYKIVEQLGGGSLGAVFKSRDEELRRDVAIKVPHPHWLITEQQVQAYLSVMRHVASLDHPGIVPLYDTGRTDDGLCYVVTKFMTAGSLLDRARGAPFSAARSVRLVVDVARTMHDAHRKDLVHRNLKPANVLFDDHHRPCVTDFGMPVADEALPQVALEEAIHWLAPEQLRSEMHRVDARTDVYTLGLILYWLLARRLPFPQQRSDERMAAAQRSELPDLLEIVPTLPVELARVCHRAAARRMSDRYSTAIDFADELEKSLVLLSDSFEKLDTPSGEELPSSGRPIADDALVSDQRGATLTVETTVKVVPKGLRSFDREDAEFFLELVPGPCGRDGLPESVRFWKQHLEECDPELTFAVGLIYGPSGCGKSSLVKAGLIPRLEPHVIPIYLEATPDETEKRLLAALRRRFPQLPAELSLIDTLAEIRRGHCVPVAAKVVVILDQFEQWLHNNREIENPELMRALRQCDGRHLQGVVMVRDDFWMAVTRFMHKLEVRLIEGKNSAAIDLFSPQHARRVLIAFGRAYGCLPEHEADFKAAELEFVREAIEGLTSDGKVISVQLSLFADMVKHKPWVPATLRDVGGTAGIGVAFLEETFTGAHAPPEHRRHQSAARAVLKQLLPDHGTDIKGRMHAREQLLAASGYSAQPQEFDELIQLLDHELRLVTPADPEGMSDQTRVAAGETATSYYQLTHDYLVLSIRRWLVHKQQETMRGRAELLLAETASTWSHRRDARFLPSVWQWSRMRILTARQNWNRAEQSLMRAAGRYYGLRLTMIFAAAIALVAVGYEGLQYIHAQALRDRLLFATTAEVPRVVAEIGPYRRWTRPLLQDVIAHRSADSRETLHARLALLADDASQLDPLFQRTLIVDDATYPILVQSLSGYREKLNDRLWKLLNDQNTESARRLRAAMLLAQFDPPQNDGASSQWVTHSNFVAQSLLQATLSDPTRFQSLVKPLAPIAPLLIEPLRQSANDSQRSEAERAIASNLFIHFASDRTDLLVDMLLAGGSAERQTAIINKLVPHREQAVALLTPVVQSRADSVANTIEVQGQKSDAVKLPPHVVEHLAAGAGMASDRSAFCQTLPFSDFTKLAEELQAAGYRPIRIRPYKEGNVLRVAAGWVRDGREGIFRLESTPDFAELMSKELLVDVSSYSSDDGQLRNVFVWEKRKQGDPKSEVFTGSAEEDRWPQVLQTKTQVGFGVSSIDISPVLQEGRHIIYATFWEVPTTLSSLQPRARYERELAGQLAGKLQTTVELTIVPTRTYHEVEAARRHSELQLRAARLKTNPNDVEALYHSGWTNLHLGNDKEAIPFFSQYLDSVPPNSDLQWRQNNSYTMRYLAAARAKDERADEFISAAVAKVPLDAYTERFWRSMGGIANGSVSPEEFEKYAEPRFPAGYVLRDTALVFAWAATAAKRIGDSELADRYTLRAVDYVRRAFQVGEIPTWLFNEIWFSGILDDPRVQRLQWETEIYNLPVVPLARQGALEGARSELARYLEGTADAVQKMRVETATLAYLGEYESATRKIESALAAKTENDYLNYWGACTSLLMLSELIRPTSAEQSENYANRAIEILSERIATVAGEQQVIFRRELISSPWFFPLRGHSQFAQLIDALGLQYTATFETRSDLESRELHNLDSQQHLEQCRALAEQGWQLAAIDVCLPAGSSAPTAASVWHRTRFTELERNQFASRVAAAGAALLRIGPPELVWPLLEQSSDPQVRTTILTLLGPAGVDPETIVQGLRQTASPSIRRSLLLALGSYPKNRFTAERQKELIQTVDGLLRNDNDAGVHGTCQWLLRNWGESERLKDAERELVSARSPSARQWHGNSMGQTFTQIDGPIEFEMGTPVTDVEGDPDERLHRRRIPRSFEIATSEVTVEQFKKLLDAHPEILHPSRGGTVTNLDRPVNMVNFYHAAQFCRWLSEQEGIPESEMVYPPVDEIGPDMLLNPFALSRSGYRLPTEPEWEFACRAGTVTPRYFGRSSDHLSRFGWFKDNSQKSLWPVAQLWPNDFGLFDMYGNAEEMCDEHVEYPRPNTSDVMRDEHLTQRLPARMSVRGGSIVNGAAMARSADRYDYVQLGYGSGLPHVGFRIVRTVPPPELLAARALRDRIISEGPQQALNDELRRDAYAAYDRILSSDPTNQDYAWEFAELLLDESGGWFDGVQENKNETPQSGFETESDGSIVIVTPPVPGNIASLRLSTRWGSFAARDATFAFDAPDLRVLHSGQSTPPGSAVLSTGFHTGSKSKGYLEFPWKSSEQSDVVTWSLDPPVKSSEPVRLALKLRPHENSPQSLALRLSVSAAPDASRIQQWHYHLSRSTLNGYARLACAWMLRGESDLAVRALKQAGPNPAGAEVRDSFLLSALNRELQRNDQAEQLLARAMARWEESTADFTTLRLAADSLAITTEAHPTEPAGLARRAGLLMRVDTEAAAGVYERAFQLSQDPKILIARARFYAEIGESQRAEIDFKRAAELNATELDRFLQSGWWVVGTFPLGTAVEAPQIDPNPTATYSQRDQQNRVRWQVATPGALGEINLRPTFNADNVSIYAMTYVYSPDDRAVLFLAGADDSMRVWVNGEFAGELLTYNVGVLDPPLVIPINLRAGKNVILAKIENGRYDYGFNARLGDHPLSQARWLASIGLWKEAAPFYERVLANGQFSVVDRHALEYQFALALVATGDSHDTDRVRPRAGPGGRRFRRQPGAARRQRDGLYAIRIRHHRKMVVAA